MVFITIMDYTYTIVIFAFVCVMLFYEFIR